MYSHPLIFENYCIRPSRSRYLAFDRYTSKAYRWIPARSQTPTKFVGLVVGYYSILCPAKICLWGPPSPTVHWGYALKFNETPVSYKSGICPAPLSLCHRVGLGLTTLHSWLEALTDQHIQQTLAAYWLLFPQRLLYLLTASTNDVTF